MTDKDNFDACLDNYRRHLNLAADWLVASQVPGGGSAAHYMVLRGFSRAYPETTGYIIPTLLRAARVLDRPELDEMACRFGDWLRSIQSEAGYWPAGLYPPRGRGTPSIFNTGQILKGMVALYEASQDRHFLEAASRAAKWLADGVDPQGVWREGHYRPGYQPSYYTRVAWPMLMVWQQDGEIGVKDAAVRVLDHTLGHRRDNGAFTKWAFRQEQPAFTHTIAYTLRGLLESAEILADGERFLDAARPAVERLYRQTEMNRGALPGRYDLDWKPDRSFVCLTGCAQTALLFLRLDRREPDLRLVNAAAKLVDFVWQERRWRGWFLSDLGPLYPLPLP